MRKIFMVISIGALIYGTGVLNAELARSQTSPGAQARILSPANGTTVPATFTVQFGLKGMGVAPAGSDIPGTGHHHLLVDNHSTPDFGTPLPASKNIIHFGKGQTETELTLAAGEHTLQLLLGDYLHIPHDVPVLSEKITITVAQ